LAQQLAIMNDFAFQVIESRIQEAQSASARLAAESDGDSAAAFDARHDLLSFFVAASSSRGNSVRPAATDAASNAPRESSTNGGANVLHDDAMLTNDNDDDDESGLRLKMKKRDVEFLRKV
jgi:hypothetical protein